MLSLSATLLAMPMPVSRRRAHPQARQLAFLIDAGPESISGCMCMSSVRPQGSVGRAHLLRLLMQELLEVVRGRRRCSALAWHPHGGAAVCSLAGLPRHILGLTGLRIGCTTLFVTPRTGPHRVQVVSATMVESPSSGHCMCLMCRLPFCGYVCAKSTPSHVAQQRAGGGIQRASERFLVPFAPDGLSERDNVFWPQPSLPLRHFPGGTAILGSAMGSPEHWSIRRGSEV